MEKPIEARVQLVSNMQRRRRFSDEKHFVNARRAKRADFRDAALKRRNSTVNNML